MPVISRRLSVEQGFDFNKAVQAPLGFISAMKIGSKALRANLNCKKATNPKQGLKANTRLPNLLNESLSALGTSPCIQPSSSNSTTSTRHSLTRRKT